MFDFGSDYHRKPPPTSLPGLTSPTGSQRPSLSRKNSFTLPDVPASEYYRIYQESKSASSSRKNSFNSKSSSCNSSLRHESVVAALNQHNNVYTTTSEDEHSSMESRHNRPEIKISGGKIADR